MVAMKKRYHHLNEVSINVSRGSDWYKMKIDNLNKRTLDINHHKQERRDG